MSTTVYSRLTNNSAFSPLRIKYWIEPVIEKMPNDSRRASVSVAGDGIEIGRLQIHMDKQRTSHIKNTILEARFDEPNALDQTGSKFGKISNFGKSKFVQSWKTRNKRLENCARFNVGHVTFLGETGQSSAKTFLGTSNFSTFSTIFLYFSKTISNGSLNILVLSEIKKTISESFQ